MLSRPLDAPIFILGATRSGTTMLALMLGHHSDIAYASELAWVWDGMESAEPSKLPQYHAWLMTQRAFRFSQLQIDPALGFRELTRDLLAQLRDRCADDAAYRKSRVVSQVHRHYEQALLTFPRARFIHIVRDGRDVCASWIRLGWLGNGYEGGLRWKRAIEEWEGLKPCIPPDQRIELRFRELVSSPREELQRICEFLGVRFEQAMLQYHEDTPYEPVDSGQTGKWRTQLAPRDQVLFESVAGPALVRNGYALSRPGTLELNGPARAIALAEDKLKHHRARIERYGVRIWVEETLSRAFGLSGLRRRSQYAIDAIDNERVRTHRGRLR